MTARDAVQLCPDGGILYDLSNEAYHSMTEAVSNSMLSDFARSPAHCWALHFAPDRPPRTVKAGQLEGTLMHCATFEPELFAARYAALPADAPRKPTDAQWKAKNPSPDSLAAMDWWRAFSASASGEIISAELHATALAQAQSVRRVPELQHLLAAGHGEVSVFWVDPASGLQCRCRPDWVHPVNDEAVILVDGKTYSDCSPDEFARQVARKGYHRQAAFYSDGYAAASGKKVLGFVFAAVESAYPHLAAAHMLDDAGIDKGRELNRALLDRYAECKASGIWPGFPGVNLITLPRWAA